MYLEVHERQPKGFLPWRLHYVGSNWPLHMYAHMYVRKATEAQKPFVVIPNPVDVITKNQQKFLFLPSVVISSLRVKIRFEGLMHRASSSSKSLVEPRQAVCLNKGKIKSGDDRKR